MKNFSDWIFLFSIAIILFASYFVVKINTREKVQSFVKSKRNLIVLILGQSNAANYGEAFNRTEENIYMYFQQEIYRAKDPLLGSSGKKGSIWIPVFEELKKSRGLESILIVNIAQGSSSVREWQPNGIYGDQLRMTLSSLLERDLRPDFICWQQGEQDNLNDLSKDEYKNAFLNIKNEIHNFIDKIPILISITSFHPGSINPINKNIRAAQSDLIEQNKSLFQGPDTDLYIDDCRYDGIHFSTKGMNLVSQDWVKSINHFLDSNQFDNNIIGERF